MENVSSVSCLPLNSDIKFATLFFSELCNYSCVLLGVVCFELLWSQTIDLKGVNTDWIVLTISVNPCFAIKCVIINSRLLFLGFSEAVFSESNSFSNEGGLGRVHIF